MHGSTHALNFLTDGSDTESQSSGDSESDVEQQFEVGRTIQVQVSRRVSVVSIFLYIVKFIPIFSHI